MTVLSQLVHLDPNFARSTRLDADFTSGIRQEKFILQASTAKSLTDMANAQSKNGQGAFTWTGPYGSGKSSTALLLANYIGTDEQRRREAAGVLGQEVSTLLSEAFNLSFSTWRVIPITGRRASLQQTLTDVLAAQLNWTVEVTEAIDTGKMQITEAILASLNADGSCLLLFLDELGRFLEYAEASTTDIHLLQDLAEACTRSANRLVVIGILHQSFDQYASRLGRDARQEWMKVQGRFHDLSFLTRVDETVSLLSQAIQAPETPDEDVLLARQTAQAVSMRRPIDVDTMSELLSRTWPLNPVTALLLGPIARQRFAQNERSVFGFLMSAEPLGFVEFLNSTETASGKLYGPDALWDYLDANFGLALTSGPDGHLFSLAHEAIARAAARGKDDHVAVVKSAAVIELFGQGTGLAVNDTVLMISCPKVPAERLLELLSELVEWAIFVRQPRLASYAIFAGSDFDLQDAVSRTTQALTTQELMDLPQRLGLSFVTAKRHYFQTGVLRAFDVTLLLIEESASVSETIQLLTSTTKQGTGQMILLIPGTSQTSEGLGIWQRELTDALKDARLTVATGRSVMSEVLIDGAVNLTALETIISKYPQLQGDRIARREIAARRSQVITALQRDLVNALDSADWMIPGETVGRNASLVEIASRLADTIFDKTPVVKSELIQRDRLSSSAAAAQRELMHAMVRSAAVEHLGMTGFSAAMGLYLTVLDILGLHRDTGKKIFAFMAPDKKHGGETLLPAWAVLQKEKRVRLADVFDQWSAPPYGIKQGLMPILALAYILQNAADLAVYIAGHYEVEINDVFVDRFLQDPRNVELQGLVREQDETMFLSDLAVRLAVPIGSTALTVAQHLFRKFALLPEFAKRSTQLSEDTRRIRDEVLNASDPETLLFETMKIYEASARAQAISEALTECEVAFETMLGRLHAELADAVGVEVGSFAGTTDRALLVQGVGGDLRFDNFLMRLMAFERNEGDIAGLAGMLVGKPAKLWVDRDVDKASIEIAKLGRQFRELEAFAFVKNRKPSAKALALAVGVRANEPTRFARLELNEEEDTKAYALAKEMMTELTSRVADERVRFGMLAHLVELLLPQPLEETK